MILTLTIDSRWYGVKISGAGAAFLALVLSLLVFSGCLGLKAHKRQPDTDDKTNDCSGVSCWEPPQTTCAAGDALQVYAPSGYCSGGDCSYATREEQCHSGLCEGGVCVTTPCQGMTCIDPPPAFCTEADRTIFAPSGYCSGGKCEYASKKSDCDFTCESGSCADSPCAEVYCRKPPAPYCRDKSNLVVFEPEGRCTVVEGRPKCLHESQIIACDHGCKDGRCQDDPCVGVVCDRPPARYCDGAELVLFEPYGVCNERGFCAYIEQRKPCIEPCIDAHCGEDPACTSDCNEPPASYCLDDTVLRVYAREGICEDGFCSYVYSDIEGKDCPGGCEDGRCKDDPCIGVSCDQPPANYCDGSGLVGFEQKGSCNDGVCSYPKNGTSCPDGCENAMCLPGSDTDTDTDTETGPDTDTDTDGGPDWVTIPAGSFWMGTPDGSCPADYPGGAACASELGRDGNEDLHYVKLTYDFELMRTEVTQGQFEALMGYNPSYFASCGTSCPVEMVSWDEASAYANALSQQAGYGACYDCTGMGSSVTCSLKAAYAKPQGCPGYRLPTESEWEYAARAGRLTAFYNGAIANTECSPLDANLDAIGWYCGNSYSATSTYPCSSWYVGATTCGPQPVAGKTANEWGLYDMSGNVQEWTWDWYESAYPAGTISAPLVDPVGPVTASIRVFRGGSWRNSADYARSGDRYESTPTIRYFALGFRLARSVP